MGSAQACKLETDCAGPSRLAFQTKMTTFLSCFKALLKLCVSHVRVCFLSVGRHGSRWVFSGHLPFSDLYESLVFLSWTFPIFYMVPCFKKPKNYYLNTRITPSVIFTQGFAISGLLTEIHESLILIP